jgi:hypothetical protein
LGLKPECCEVFRLSLLPKIFVENRHKFRGSRIASDGSVGKVGGKEIKFLLCIAFGETMRNNEKYLEI